ncbi:MAG: Grx4 family monothiol glutaredoxin [Sandaracinaceae bacterium]|nr:Grx4 family monothiol glutaredoxin [Sandaracinaceae bacterium]
MNEELRQRIQSIINSHKIVLFMKGTKNFPQCGFSARVVEVLNQLKADFHAVNVLADQELRQGMKEFSNWPTFPQLYIEGRFIGGCDIVCEMFEQGELQPLIERATKLS